ncbi:Translation initiation factor IF-3 [Choanephora cucurbitarum]|uniref:Translation initiation factor IF-3 n=1 Tax=Choanephora cucurbitarum TaxID=101091 RepID=A0A1C7N9Z0_9FUNG|nr:Translation initiation factor IF-3 [Choanephora cucurbitarum]
MLSHTHQLLRRLTVQQRYYSSLAQVMPILAKRQSMTGKPPRPIQPLQPEPIKPPKMTLNRPRRDEEITSRFITFVDEQGQVHHRSRVIDILSSFDRSRFFLVEVDPTAKPNPVCRLLDKKALFEKEKQSKKKKQTAPESVLKEIVFGWNVSAHDMEHKLNKAVQFLDKGNKVKIEIVYKRGQVRLDKEEQKKVIQTVTGLMDQYKLTKQPAFAGQNCAMQFERK